MNKHFYLTALLGFFGMFAQLGCSATSTTIADSNELHIKVYRVIGEFDSHTSPAGNEGCRLTDAEINTIIDQLSSNAPLGFGPSTKVIWDGVIFRITDTQITFHDIGYPVDSLDFLLNAQFPSYTAAFAVNIYFTGNYTNVGETVYGAAIDPLDSALHTTPFPGNIIINDAGFDSSSGSNVAALLNLLILEHEMGHYLGRFNKTFVPGGSYPPPNTGTTGTRDYGSSALGSLRTFYRVDDEHVYTPLTHLMLAGGLVPNDVPRTMSLPGVHYPLYNNVALPAGINSANQLGAERGEVSRKLFLGEFNEHRR